MDKINLQEEVIRDDQGRPCPHARWTHSVLPSTLVYIEEEFDVVRAIMTIDFT